MPGLRSRELGHRAQAGPAGRLRQLECRAESPGLDLRGNCKTGGPRGSQGRGLRQSPCRPRNGLVAGNPGELSLRTWNGTPSGTGRLIAEQAGFVGQTEPGRREQGIANSRRHHHKDPGLPNNRRPADLKPPSSDGRVLFCDQTIPLLRRRTTSAARRIRLHQTLDTAQAL